MPTWALGAYSYAYFMAGRVEDALWMLDRKPRESYRRSHYAFRAAILGALGRADEARLAVAEALERFPELTVEGFAGTPDWSDAERQRLTDTMRKAGFPACAGEEDLKNMPGLKRLPECEAERAKMAATKS